MTTPWHWFQKVESSRCAKKALPRDKTAPFPHYVPKFENHNTTVAIMRTIDLAAGDSSSSSDEDDGIIICRRRRQPSLACLSNPKQQKKREPRCQTLKNRRTNSNNPSLLAQSPDERKMPFSSDNMNNNSNVDENDGQESSLRRSARQRYNNNNDESQSPMRKRSRGEDGRGGFDGISATDSDNDMDDSNSCNLLVARKPTPAEAKRLRSLNNNEVRSVTNDEEEEEEEVRISEVIDLSSPIARRRSTAAIMNNGMMGPSSTINSWDQLHRSHAAMSSHAAASSQRYQYRTNMDMPINVAAASTTPVSNGRTRNESRQHRQDVATSRNVTVTSSRRTQRQQQQQQQWACPRCTLLNNQDHSICGACQHENPTHRNNNVVGSGRSSSVAASVSDNDRVIAEAMAAAEGGSNFGTLGRGYRNNTGSLTSAFHPSLDGMMARMIAQQFGPTNPFSHLLTSTGFMRTGPSQQRGENVDNMSYEQLLQRFGNGCENRGATTETISSLPISIINDPGHLPEDKRQCCICLEDFSRGDGRTSLPCLHGFHTDCVNKWLQSNGSCPICKSSVKGD